jgi:hypothetical protein
MRIMIGSDQIDQILTKAVEDRARIERAFAPNRALADIVKAIQPSAYLFGLQGLLNSIHGPP